MQSIAVESDRNAFHGVVLRYANPVFPIFAVDEFRIIESHSRHTLASIEKAAMYQIDMQEQGGIIVRQIKPAEIDAFMSDQIAIGVNEADRWSSIKRRAQDL
jgi:hypothetical protein